MVRNMNKYEYDIAYQKLRLSTGRLDVDAWVELYENLDTFKGWYPMKILLAYTPGVTFKLSKLIVTHRDFEYSISRRDVLTWMVVTRREHNVEDFWKTKLMKVVRVSEQLGTVAGLRVSGVVEKARVMKRINPDTQREELWCKGCARYYDYANFTRQRTKSTRYRGKCKTCCADDVYINGKDRVDKPYLSTRREL